MRKLAAVTALVALLLAGCVSRQDSSGTSEAPATVALSELSDLTLNVGDQKGGTEALLRAAGALDNLPYKIAFSTFTSGPPQIEAATAGKIDFAITGNTPPIFGAASNAKVKIVSAYDGSGFGDQILVHADSPIRSVATCGARRSPSPRAAPRTATYWLSSTGRTDAGRCRTGVPAACRRAVGVHAATGRCVGDLGPLHRPGRNGYPGAQYRRAPRASPTAPASASPPMPRWPTETQHRAERLAGAVREGRAVGSGQPRAVGESTLQQSAWTLKSRRWPRAAAYGCPPTCPTSSSRLNRSWLICSRNRSRSARRRSSPAGSTDATATCSRPCTSIATRSDLSQPELSSGTAQAEPPSADREILLVPAHQR